MYPLTIALNLMYHDNIFLVNINAHKLFQKVYAQFQIEDLSKRCCN